MPFGLVDHFCSNGSSNSGIHCLYSTRHQCIAHLETQWCDSLDPSWKTGEKQRFLVTVKAVDGNSANFAGYYSHPDRKKLPGTYCREHLSALLGS
ncbi:MAG TPA: hypothetical protein EYQ50_28470 [Verrucomicrobiales bacterium]|nr:hypothetical protein [Verrucomicrobiales bacterium]HIL68753.1 hypothetical protein [Verrucomicrobiota bacterium]